MLLEASVTKDSANNNSRLKWNKFVVVIVKKRVREAIKREVEKRGYIVVYNRLGSDVC